jgi:hypothetical protein
VPDALFYLAQAEGIICRYVYLPVPFLGLYDARAGEPTLILLHETLKQKRCLLRCILAEELGHHFTSSGNLLAFARSDKSFITLKQEKNAMWWAVQQLVPIKELISAVEDGLVLTHELADHFGVTERFMGTALRLYYGETF